MVRMAVETAQNMIVGFQQPYQDEDLSRYLSRFSEDIHWYDHAFRICRVGRTAISGLRTAWLLCNQPFDAKIKVDHVPLPSSELHKADRNPKSIEATSDGAIAEVVWHGRTTNDIIRPDGQIAVKATGKDFVCHVCMLFKINGDNEITRIDEYYNKQWDDGIDENQYHVMKGQSLQEEKT